MVLFRQWVASTIVAIAAAACGTAGAACTPPEAAGYVGGKKDDRPSVVVFVHGLGGDPVGTWTWTSFLPWVSPVYWPCLVRDNEEFARSNVYVHGYVAPVGSESPSIDQLSAALFDQLLARGVLDHKHISLVAHSLGGLLVQRMLVRLAESGDRAHQTILARVRLTQFYGVPALGADTAVWARRFSDSRVVGELSEEARLRGWLDRWRRVGRSFRRDCLSEASATGPVWPFTDRVVSEASALALCEDAGNVQALANLDHFAIVKPAGSGDAPAEWLYAGHANCLRPRLRETRPVAGRSAIPVEAVRQWYRSVAASFRDRQTDGRAFAKQRVVMPTQGWGVVRFVRPNFGGKGGGVARYSVTNSGDELALDFAEQFREYADLLDIVEVVPVRQVPHLLSDHNATAMVDNLMAEKVVNEDDPVLLLGPPTPGMGARMLMFLQNTPDRLALKGYLLLDRDLGCV